MVGQGSNFTFSVPPSYDGWSFQKGKGRLPVGKESEMDIRTKRQRETQLYTYTGGMDRQKELKDGNRC